MTNRIGATSTHQKQATLLLRRAKRVLGLAAMREMLPPHFGLSVVDHDTGCQCSLYLTAKDLPPAYVWDGSVWYASCYEFNDEGKVLGVQQGFEFAIPEIEAFFQRVGAETITRETRDAVERVTVEAATKATKSRVRAAYEALLRP